MLRLLFVLLLVACQVPAPAAQMSPTDARLSTFRVDLLGGGSGTAWVAANRDEKSLLVTAGHVCDDAAGWLLVGANGAAIRAWPVKLSAKFDLCLLSAEETVGPPLTLAVEGPAYDEPLMAVGAPRGVYGCDSGASIARCGMAPISRGYYAGGTLVSMPMYGGNSGSAVFSNRGVIGVLVEGYPGAPTLSFIEPLDHLREFLDNI